MSLVRQIYQGKDLVISRETLEAMGLKPGDAVIVRSQTSPEFTPVSQEEQARRREIMQRLAKGWKVADLNDFDQRRQAAWQQWTAFNS
jgi:hypothetical protein